MGRSIFSEFNPRLQDAIVHRVGWTSLREVQEQAGRVILDGKNAVVLAPTAGGKTEASMFPALSMMLDAPPEGVGVLYVAPIKALLNNQSERLGQYTEMVGLRRFVWHGDQSPAAKQAFVKTPDELLMTTPESLEVMFISKKVPTPRLFKDLRMVVVDEVHAFAGTDRGAHLMSVIERLAALSRHDVQRVGLSATVGNPEAILEWLSGSSQLGQEVVDPPKAPARRELLVTCRESMGELAEDASELAAGQKSLFFCQSRATAEAMATRMRQVGTTVFVHHSSVSREEREDAEARFSRGRDVCIVCTSTLELGIDVGDLDKVFQSNATDTVSSFMQRMGRTGRRAGQNANMTFFCESPEAVTQAAGLIELAKTGWVESVPSQTRCWPVLVHQLLALTIAEGMFEPDDAWAAISRVPDFSGVTRARFDELIAHMETTGFLYRVGPAFTFGDRAEKVFGRRNFMELYAVFSSPQLFAVVTPSGKELGSLEQQFVDQLLEDQSSFLLGGRPWSVTQVDFNRRRIEVMPAPHGKRPSWGGFMPQFLSRELTEAMREILRSDARISYLHTSAQLALDVEREYFAPLFELGDQPVERGAGELIWWTFAGGRINTTLKYVLQALYGWKIAVDNRRLRIEGDGLLDGTFEVAQERLSHAAFWEEELPWEAILAALPDYRLSKFQPALPEGAQREMVSEFLLDVGAARGWCGGGR
ncbi:DEAD/DEAH box helicase [Lujinxingia vulgaris]|uniref:DEAD/DEAH box helicase n=1 Tax=Lujinxingia vulgaris TaxID=2600176 RepID=A0A5C6XFM5_9DELT|nr:DEAD/DEAH box helicase [Lujinxingia vulgaris]TXD36978.1 DEAD/DEAH box helicase [Lujinxingia vulgaris]